MLREEVTEFIVNVPPFNLLSGAELASIVDVVDLKYYPKGEMILIQDGPPSAHLCIVKKGGVKVYVVSAEGKEVVVDFRSEGEFFGLLSLVSGDHSRTNVVAEEDTICYEIPRDTVLEIIKSNPQANEFFLKSFFINFIDKAYEESTKKYTGASSGDRLLFITPLGEFVRDLPVTVSPGLTIQQAAMLMVEHKISSVVVVDATGAPVGLVTDRDLREKVVARAIAVDIAVSSIMTSPLITMDASEYCFEALLKMMHYKIHHLLVMDGKHFKGIVTNHDFMVLQGMSPTLLVKEITHLQSVEDLQGTASKLWKMVANLLREGARPHNIYGLVTELAEKIINSVVSFFERDRGAPPVSYALFLFGEGGRREMTLDLQIKLGVVYQDVAAQEDQEGAAAYFVTMAQWLNESLMACFTCGRGFCARNEHVMNMSAWQNRFVGRSEEGKSGQQAEFFEMRAIRGNTEWVDTLRSHLFERAVASREFMNLVATATVQNRAPLGFFKKMVVEKSGEHKNELNLAEKGIKPLVDIVRLFCLEQRIEQLSTGLRLRQLKLAGFEMADEIEHALDYLGAMLLHVQLQQINGGAPPDSFVNPDSLSNFERKTLKESFNLIATLHEMIEERYRTERLR